MARAISGGISCRRRKDRIERAKQEWKDGKFGLIPGDDKEFIPLPETKWNCHEI